MKVIFNESSLWSMYQLVKVKILDNLLKHKGDYPRKNNKFIHSFMACYSNHFPPPFKKQRTGLN